MKSLSTGICVLIYTSSRSGPSLENTAVELFDTCGNTSGFSRWGLVADYNREKHKMIHREPFDGDAVRIDIEAH